MAKITFSKLGLKYRDLTEPVIEINDITISIKQYLTQQEKASFIAFVLENSIDDNGCFSPIRIETYWGLALMKWYADISFTEKQIKEAPKTYDILETNGIIRKVIDNIPKEEYEFLQDALEDTKEDIVRYNHSFAGILATASQSTDLMNDEMMTLLSQIKNKEGLELLSEIKNVVG